MLELPDNDLKATYVTVFYEAMVITLETTEKIKILSHIIKDIF